MSKMSSASKRSIEHPSWHSNPMRLASSICDDTPARDTCIDSIDTYATVVQELKAGLSNYSLVSAVQVAQDVTDFDRAQRAHAFERLNLDPQVPVDAIVVKCVLAHLRQCNSAIPHATPSLDSFEQCGIVIAYATIKQLPQRVGQLEAHMAAIKESAITLSILVKKLKMQNNNATNMSSRSDK